MKELYFIRHGQTEWNAIRRMQGQWKSDLSELGRDQAEKNGQFLAELEIDYIVASPLDRTRQTAEIINRYLKLDINYDERIMEWHCGDWSGEMWDEVSEKWPEEFAAWQADPFHYRGPNCENYPDMVARASPFLQEIHELAHERIAVVSHGMIGRVMVGTLLNMTPDEMFDFGQTNETVFHLSGGHGNYSTRHFIGGDGPHTGLPPRQW